MPAPTEPDLDRCFRSIEAPFEETLASEQRTDWVDTLVVAAFLAFLFSVIPAIPYGLRWLLPWLAGTSAVPVYGYSFPINSSWMWWPVCGIASFSLFLVLMKASDKRGEETRKKWLSVPHMRFACCYAIVDQIRQYQANRLQTHMDKASALWKELWERLRLWVPIHARRSPAEIATEEAYSVSAGYIRPQARFWIYPDAEYLKQEFEWFRLEPYTEVVIEALRSLPSKIPDRLKDKKDLSSLSQCLTHLAAYLYSRIPEVSSEEGEEPSESLKDFRETSLKSFTESVNLLSPYRSEPRVEPARPPVWQKLGRKLAGLVGAFSHPSVLVCFVARYVFTELLAAAGLVIALRVLPQISIDSAIVSTIIGGPLVCGVTAAAVSRGFRRNRVS